MYIRLFESGPGYDSIELNIKPVSTDDTFSLARVVTTLLEYTDIEEIGIGRERDKKKKEEK